MFLTAAHIHTPHQIKTEIGIKKQHRIHKFWPPITHHKYTWKRTTTKPEQLRRCQGILQDSLTGIPRVCGNIAQQPLQSQVSYCITSTSRHVHHHKNLSKPTTANKILYRIVLDNHICNKNAIWTSYLYQITPVKCRNMRNYYRSGFRNGRYGSEGKKQKKREIRKTEFVFWVS